MTDLEYTVFLIRKKAEDIVRMTNEPEFGLSTWYLMLGGLMKDMKDLEITQACPEHLKDVSFEAAIAKIY